MRSDEYDRLYAAFPSMAQQSSLRDGRTRWLALAQDCLSLAKDANDGIKRRAAGETLGQSPKAMRSTSSMISRL